MNKRASPTARSIPKILLGCDEGRVISQAIRALGASNDLFQRAGCLVHVVNNAPAPKGLTRPAETPCIVAASRPRLREELASHALWQRKKGGRPVRVHPPAFVVAGVEARGQWPGVRRLEAVVDRPTLRPDGSILDRPGYDPLTGLLYAPSMDFPSIPTRPTYADARSALGRLGEVVQDFPFASELDRAAVLAALITPVVRTAVDGPVPLNAFDGNTPGCGKSLLADACAVLNTGREASRVSVPERADEFTKLILSVALAGESVVLFDNVAGAFGSPVLDAALTSRFCGGRLLGTPKMLSGVPLLTTWYCTGNNLRLVGDTSRRTLYVRLNSQLERPEERGNFHQPNLVSWIKAERGRLVVAALTVIRAFIVAGRPDCGLPPWGSFEGWSNLVRQAMVFAGLPDPAATRRELRCDADRESQLLAALLEGWMRIDPAGSGMTVSQALRLLESAPQDHVGLREALLDVAGSPLTPQSVGMLLNHRKGRVADGRRFEQRRESGTNVWFVRRASQP